MQQVAGKRAHRAIDAGGFMHFAIAAPAAAAAVEQAQHAVGIGIAVAQEAPEVVRQPGEAIARDVLEAQRAFGLDAGAQGVVHAFVGVQAQHPVEAGLFDRELLLAAEALEGPLEDAGAGLAGDGDGGVGRTRVHHHDFIAEGQRRQAVGQAIGFIEGDNAGR